MNVVVFSGTTEGRELSRQLAALGIEVTVSVATPLGQEEQGSAPGVTVRCGRLLPDEMAALLGNAALCIDATHPYAVEATKNIKAAAEKAGVEYLRLLRPASPLPENCLVFESAKQPPKAPAFLSVSVPFHITFLHPDLCFHHREQFQFFYPITVLTQQCRSFRLPQPEPFFLQVSLRSTSIFAYNYDYKVFTAPIQGKAVCFRKFPLPQEPQWYLHNKCRKGSL